MGAIPAKTLDQITCDDEALLKFAFNRVRQELFK